jgi:hypothetical protein
VPRSLCWSEAGVQPVSQCKWGNILRLVNRLASFGRAYHSRTLTTYLQGPFSISNPLRGWNSDLAQYSKTPSLRAAGFEDEDENEAPILYLQRINLS